MIMLLLLPLLCAAHALDKGPWTATDMLARLQVVSEAESNRTFKQKRTLLFVDEIHRFNKAQQVTHSFTGGISKALCTRSCQQQWIYIHTVFKRFET